MKYNDDGTYEDIVIKAVAPGRNSYSSSQQEVYSCNYVNGALQDAVNGTVLYDNSSGTTTGGDILSDSVSNYNFLDVYVQYGDAGCDFQRVDLSTGNSARFMDMWCAATTTAIKQTVYSFSGTTVTRTTMGQKNITGTGGSMGQGWDTTAENGLKLRKVIGYK